MSPYRLPLDAPLVKVPVIHLHGLRRYYGLVRLPGFVHRRRSLFRFTARASTGVGAKPGISRLPREMLRCVRGVCDHAESDRSSHKRIDRCCLPPDSTVSALRSITFSRLNTRPALSPVNASPMPSRTSTHDSEPTWLASPWPYETFIHCTSPALPAHVVPFRISSRTIFVIVSNRCRLD